MLNINLLPWRAYQRAKRSKQKKYSILLSLFCGIGLCLWAGRTMYVAPQKLPLVTMPLVKKQASIQLVAHSTYWFLQPSAQHKHWVRLEAENVSVSVVLNALAKLLHINLVVLPDVTGIVFLHLQSMPVEQALASLLLAKNLSRWQVGQVWFVGTQMDFIQHQQALLKQRSLVEEMAPLVTRIWQIHYANVNDIARILQENQHSLLSKRGQVRVDIRTNMLCIQDVPDKMVEVDRLIHRLDVPVPQVLIKVRIASIDQDYQRTLGIQFIAQSTPDNTNGVSVLTSPYGLAVAKLADGALLDVQLSALESEGHGEFISSPSLFTASQQAATIEAGEEIPYQEISKSGATGVAFKKAVLSLKVTPQVLPSHQVLLQLQVNQDKPNNRLVLGVPSISTRQMMTHILVKSGQTIVLGGIFENNHEQEEHRVPFLGTIPYIGWLFKQKSLASNKRELLIFVTPIVHD